MRDPKFLKAKGDEGTIRKVVDGETRAVCGIVGTVGDLLKAGVLEYCDYSKTGWCFIPASGDMRARFGKTREEAVG